MPGKVSCWGTNWHNLHRGASHRELKGGGGWVLTGRVGRRKKFYVIAKASFKRCEYFLQTKNYAKILCCQSKFQLHFGGKTTKFSFTTITKIVNIPWHLLFNSENMFANVQIRFVVLRNILPFFYSLGTLQKSEFVFKCTEIWLKTYQLFYRDSKTFGKRLHDFSSLSPKFTFRESPLSKLY